MADARQTWDVPQVKAEESVAEIAPPTQAPQYAAPQTFVAKLKHACNVFFTVVIGASVVAGLVLATWYSNVLFGAPRFSNAAAFLAREGNHDAADILSEMGRVCDDSFGSTRACAALLRDAGLRYTNGGYAVKRQMVQIAKAEEVPQ